MKKATVTTRSFLLLVTLFLIALGCREGGSTETIEDVSESTASLSDSGDPDDNGEVRFTLDGAQWVSGPPGHPEMNFEEEAITDDNTMVRIEGLAADGSFFSLTVFNQSGIGVGTHAVKDKGIQGSYKPALNGEDVFLIADLENNPGSVTITKLTGDEVEGTFQFPMRSAGDPENIKQFTNGSFSLRFTRI